MFETNLTVIGNAVGAPRRRDTSAGEVATFRVASTARYPGEDGQWRNGGTVFVTVNCWRRLVEGAMLGVKKGAPVIVHGALRTRQYTTQDGQSRTDVEMRATSVGLDVARCLATRVEDRPGRRGGSESAAGDGRGEAGANAVAAGTAVAAEDGAAFGGAAVRMAGEGPENAGPAWGAIDPDDDAPASAEDAAGDPAVDPGGDPAVGPGGDPAYAAEGADDPDDPEESDDPEAAGDLAGGAHEEFAGV